MAATEKLIQRLQLRRVQLHGLNVGDYLLLDDKYIARVAHKGKTFLHDHPYIKVVYTIHYASDDLDGERVEQEKRTIIDNGRITVKQILRVGVDDV